MKKVLVFTLAFVMIISLVGCSGGIDSTKATATITEFFGYIESGDYTSAETLLHPDRPAHLSDFFTAFADENNIDYSSGITVVNTVSTSSAVYDSSVNGSLYSKRYIVEISGKEFESEIQVAQNDGGYGIYNFYMGEH